MDIPTLISTFSSRQLKRLFRVADNSYITAELVVSILPHETFSPEEIIHALVEMGYLQETRRLNSWQLSMRAEVLFSQKEKRIFKATTRQMQVDKLQQRILEINQDDKYPYKVLTCKIDTDLPVLEKGSVINASVLLQRKNISEKEYDNRMARLRSESTQRFDNIVQYVYYGRTAVIQYLKSGSQILQIKEATLEEIAQQEGTYIESIVMPITKGT
ncbi:MAG TPA: hypothetical protein DCR93_29055 [Cytophagales bacterium]|nr:hypothetical protein [Cytophagales bacterium]HAP63379.1 hypothetical protein [Cytophagales bacterium]